MTIIIGPNTAGKTNLVESIMLLSLGKSLRADKDFEMIRFGQDIAWVNCLVQQEQEVNKLEVMVANAQATGGRQAKKYIVNGIAKSRTHFVGNLPAVLFRPEELDIIVDGPSLRREFLDQILELVDREYRAAKLVYDKALRQRNALLDMVKETGKRNDEQFKYWDDLLIANGSCITQKREDFIQFVNTAEKDIIDCKIFYDKSVMSADRLLQYREAEVHTGMTLVGPQRDDFYIEIRSDRGQWHNVQHFGSRGQQRLVILQLKILHIRYIEKILKKKPLFVLDDIFSELDQKHISLVLERVSGQQVIMTTTHKEFVDQNLLRDSASIELPERIE